MGKSGDDITALMLEAPQFNTLSQAELEILGKHIFRKNVSENTVLCEEGSSGDSLFYVVTGKIEIRKESIDGRQTVLARFNKGASVGEMSLIEHSPRSATATAIEDSELLILTRKSFDELIESEPLIGIKILKNIAKSLSTRLRYTSGRFADVFK
ncbi:hypothetical protein MNBD_NITROSPINAE04-1411 [hydrothermal vent metagenome]|uniref:Cyclic nucleotide-binding domain-containing protein n=1 Tax=hydrothermal vent metagenome TaxID=652676 RepID=A0A3B1C214_9ZZZZ